MTVEESQDVYNYQQSAEKRASSYDSQAFNLGGGVNWKYKIHDAMSKREGKGRYTRPLPTYVKKCMLMYYLREEKSCYHFRCLFWLMNINWENMWFGCLMGVKQAGDVVLGPVQLLT